MKFAKSALLSIVFLSLLTLAAHGQAFAQTNAETFAGNWGSVAIDTSVTPHRLYVADYGNSRVLGYNDDTLTDGQAADLVIGQPGFTTGACNQGAASPSASTLCDPHGIAVDASGNLYVADSINSRVLEYNTPFAACFGVFPCVGGQANLVFGQGGSFTSAVANNGGESANSLSGPFGAAVDASGNLYISDGGNGRVLEYKTPLATNPPNTTADMVFGQCGSFTSTDNCPAVLVSHHPLHYDTVRSADTLLGPWGIAVDASGNLYVADTGNSRVLEYNTPLTNTTANVVFGQLGCFTCGGFNNGGISAYSLSEPHGVAVDLAGNVYVADYNNERLLEYNTPLTTDPTNPKADVVFGQGGSFTGDGSVVCGSAYSACLAQSPAVDTNGDLFLFTGPRVFEYYTPLTTDPANPVANVVIGRPGFAATPTPTPTATPTPTITPTPSATPTPKQKGH